MRYPYLELFELNFKDKILNKEGRNVIPSSTLNKLYCHFHMFKFEFSQIRLKSNMKYHLA